MDFVLLYDVLLCVISFMYVGIHNISVSNSVKLPLYNVLMDLLMIFMLWVSIQFVAMYLSYYYSGYEVTYDLVL